MHVPSILVFHYWSNQTGFLNVKMFTIYYELKEELPRLHSRVRSETHRSPFKYNCSQKSPQIWIKSGNQIFSKSLSIFTRTSLTSLIEKLRLFQFDLKSGLLSPLWEQRQNWWRRLSDAARWTLGVVNVSVLTGTSWAQCSFSVRVFLKICMYHVWRGMSARGECRLVDVCLPHLSPDGSGPKNTPVSSKRQSYGVLQSARPPLPHPNRPVLAII